MIFNRKLKAGLALLIVASAGKWLIAHSGLSEDVADFALGLLYGLAIGTLLWGIAEGRRRG